jgi:hypothetical protein
MVADDMETDPGRPLAVKMSRNETEQSITSRNQKEEVIDL